MPMLRPFALAALGLSLSAPDAFAQYRPRPEHRPRPERRDDARCDRRDDDCRARERARLRRARAHPMDTGVTLGLYGGSVDGLPTGGLRLGVGRVRLYAEGSDEAYSEGTDRYDEAPEQSAFGIDVLLPARAPGLRALYGVAGVGVQSRKVEYFGPYYGCPPNAYCVGPRRERRDEAFYGTLGLGVRVPVWRSRVAAGGEVTGRFVADRSGDTYAVPTANVGLTVRLGR